MGSQARVCSASRACVGSCQRWVILGQCRAWVLQCWALRDRSRAGYWTGVLSPGARSARGSARGSCFGAPSWERGSLHHRQQHAAHPCTSLGPCAVCQARLSPVGFVPRHARRSACSSSPCWARWCAASAGVLAILQRARLGPKAGPSFAAQRHGVAAGLCCARRWQCRSLWSDNCCNVEQRHEQTNSSPTLHGLIPDPGQGHSRPCSGSAV